MGWQTIIKYTLISIVRSNRFLGSYVLSILLQSLMYFSLSVLYIILVGKIKYYYVLAAIAIVDVCIKYYSPGQFTEYVHTLLKLTLTKSQIVTFITIGIIFYYFNLAILPSLAMGIAINELFAIWSIFILNHMLVFFFKLQPIFNIRSLALISLLVLAICFMVTLQSRAETTLFTLTSIVAIFSQAIKDSLYVK